MAHALNKTMFDDFIESAEFSSSDTNGVNGFLSIPYF